MAIRRSASLAAYLALARRGGNAPTQFRTLRPEGPLVWGHATSVGRVAALLQIATRLKMQLPTLNLVLTTTPDIPKPFHLEDWCVWQEIPEDTLQNGEAFLTHWKPDICLWTGGHFRPALLHQAEKLNMKMFLIDVDSDGLSATHNRWLPELTRANLRAFQAVFARTGTAAQTLRRFGGANEIAEVTGPLQEGGVPLECNEREREEMSQILAGRPIWLAAMVQGDELKTVLDAHRKVSRMALRLLLILVPDDETDGPEFLEVLKREGFNTAVWSHDEVPDETCQVLLADTWGDLGLWYRLSPVTLMASSLTQGQSGGDPYEPAALGSAVLYGPHVGRHLATYSRFAAAGAARIVKDAESLAGALQQLLAPDQAALMAAAGWEVASEGAEVTDRVINMVLETLDELEVS